MLILGATLVILRIIVLVDDWEVIFITIAVSLILCLGHFRLWELLLLQGLLVAHLLEATLC